MKHEAVRTQLEALAAFPGMLDCAVMDAATGMSWYHTGSVAQVELFEAAIEFWRVQRRLERNFASFGPARSAACSFRDGVIALFPCCEDPPLVLVCVTDQSSADWPARGPAIAALRRALSEAVLTA